jgi:hypothetical protein
MKKQLLSLSVASAIALAGGIPSAHALEECQVDINGETVTGVLVQSRFALANCMLEAAASMAKAAATKNGCQEAEWDIKAIVPEFITRLIPLQGTTTITGNGDAVELNGVTSALEQNNINCRITTTDADNVFAGEPVTFSSGFDNYYVSAIIDRDSNKLCITKAVSSGDIELGNDDYDEANELTFEYDAEDDAIEAEGWETISESRGGGGGGQSQGPGQGGNPGAELSYWDVEEEVMIPPQDDPPLPEAFELEAVTDDVGSPNCKVEIEGSVENLFSYIIEGVTGGLTIEGTLSIEPYAEEPE